MVYLPKPRYNKPVLTVKCARCKALYDAKRSELKQHTIACPFCGNKHNDFHNVIHPLYFRILKLWRWTVYTKFHKGLKHAYKPKEATNG